MACARRQRSQDDLSYAFWGCNCAVDSRSSCLRPMVGNFFLLEQFPDTLQLADFFSAVKEDTVGMNLEMHKATFVEVASEAVFISAIGLLHMQDQLIEVVRVVM